MNIQQCIQKAHLLAKGKSTPLDTAGPVYQKYLAIANLMKDSIIEEDIDWDFTYEPFSLGTITDDRIEIDETVYDINKSEDDPIAIVHSGGVQTSYYRLVEPSELEYYKHNNTCAWVGTDLVFSHTFTATDPQYNGEVFIPAHITPEDFVSPGDEITIPIPNWLAYMIAAETVRNTVTKQNQLPQLLAYANNAMNKMRARNIGQYNSMRLYPSVLGESYLGGSGAYSNSVGQALGD
jgi:hypothetical protein